MTWAPTRRGDFTFHAPRGFHIKFAGGYSGCSTLNGYNICICIGLAYGSRILRILSPSDHLSCSYRPGNRMEHP